MRRVHPDSTSSSIIASACSTPDWGWALGWLSTLTAMSFRSSNVASSTGRPVSGDSGPEGAGSVVDVTRVDELVVSLCASADASSEVAAVELVDAMVVVVESSASVDRPQAVAIRMNATKAAMIL